MPSPGSLRGLPREAFVLAAVAFCVALGFGIVAPAIPLFARELGVGTTAAGAVVSAFAVMRLLFGLAGGRIVDRVGERVALVGGIAVVAVSSLLAGLSASYGQLLVLRGVGGVGSAVFTIAALSLVLRVASAGQRGQAMSVYRGGFLVGGIVGPALGGAVLGLSLRAPFFLYAGTLVLAALAGALWLPRPAREEAGAAAPAPRTTLGEALARPAYQAALVGNFAIGFALLGVRSTLVPLLVVVGLGLPPGLAGVALLVTAVASTAFLLPAGRAVDRVGRRPTLVGGGLLSAAALASLAVVDGAGALMVAMAAFGVGSAFLSVVPGVLVGDVVEGRGGTAVAVFQMSSDLGSVVGPVLAGLLVERASFDVAFLVSAAVVGASGLAGLAVPRAPASAGPG